MRVRKLGWERTIVSHWLPFQLKVPCFKNINRHSEKSGEGTDTICGEYFKVPCVVRTQRQSLETSEWNVTVRGTTTKLIIVYRPPYSETYPVPPSVFFQEFSHYFESVVLPEVLVISGGFNSHMGDPFDNDAKRVGYLLSKPLVLWAGVVFYSYFWTLVGPHHHSLF